jgi:uncharacterized tellurite resistance protein B-like protein
MFNLKKRLFLDDEDHIAENEEDHKERIRIATCVLLLEVAKSDEEKKFQLASEATRELVSMAERKRQESVDLFEFTNLLNKHYSTEERINIVEDVWEVIYADKKLDMYEDHFVHRLAKLLRLHHDQMIEAKMRVLDRVRDTLSSESL